MTLSTITEAPIVTHSYAASELRSIAKHMAIKAGYKLKRYKVQVTRVDNTLLEVWLKVFVTSEDGKSQGFLRFNL